METTRRAAECSRELAGAGIGSNSSPADDRKASPGDYDHERGLVRRPDIPPEGQMEERAQPSPKERVPVMVVRPRAHRQSSL